MGQFLVILFVVFAAGTATNVENSGNPVDSPKEAYERVVADIKDGFENGEPITQAVYEREYNQ